MGLRDTLDEQNTLTVVVLAAVVTTVVVGLLVAVVVPVVGTFVLGAGDQVSVESPGPEASFSISSADGRITISHTGGTAVSAEKLLVTVNGSTESWATRKGGDGSVEKGDTVTVSGGSGTTVKLVYDGEKRTTLAIWRA
ncbi:MAG: hypothetical protein ABEI99_09525 [Halobaculum sp.]